MIRSARLRTRGGLHAHPIHAGDFSERLFESPTQSSTPCAVPAAGAVDAREAGQARRHSLILGCTSSCRSRAVQSEIDRAFQVEIRVK